MSGDIGPCGEYLFFSYSECFLLNIVISDGMCFLSSTHEVCSGQT